MMPAAKHGDPQIGVDIHLCVVPPSPSPVPLPTPHTSIVFDPFDYVPILGATVTVCGMKRAVAGTSGKAIHIPPGFPFAPKIPDTSDEIFMGSATVIADGDPFSFLGVPVLACQVAGMPSPPRPKQHEKKLMLLPTVTNLAIPTSVFVGGPPTISMMGMAFKLGFAALGRFAKSGLFKRMRQKLFGKMKPGFLKCVILRAEPVDITSGEVSIEHEDFTLPGCMPIQWTRSYTSNSSRQGACGTGWETPADIRLEIFAADNSAIFLKPGGPAAVFPSCPARAGHAAAVVELWDGARLSNHGDAFQVRTKEDRIYHFDKGLGFAPQEGVREYLVTRISDLCGNSLVFERQGRQLARIRESDGRCLEIESDETLVRRITLRQPETEFEQVLVEYAYNETADLVEVRDELHKPFRFAYDRHRLIRHTNRNGLSFHYQYEQTREDWRVVHTWGDGGLYNYRFRYLEEAQEVQITDSLGHVTTVTLDERRLPISELDPLGGVTTYEYDEVGRTASVVDQDEYRTSYEYDDRGNLLELTLPDGSSISAEFDENNKAVQVADGNGAVWLQNYDTRGLLLSRLTPMGRQRHYTYDARGRLVGLVDRLGKRETLHYTADGKIDRIVDAAGCASSMGYDALGNLASRTDPLGRQTSYSYDAKGQLRRVVLPSGATNAFDYDAEANLVSHTGPDEERTAFEYCGLEQIRRRVQANGHTVEYEYDTEERLILVRNQNGQTCRFTRDPMGRIVEEIDYWGQTKRHSYSAAGHLVATIDAEGRKTTFKTDPLGRVVERLTFTRACPAAAEKDEYVYDGNGNLVAFSNAAVHVERTFDRDGRLVEERQGDDVIVSSAFDADGNLARRTATLLSGREAMETSASYTYDAAGRVQEIGIPDHIPWKRQYDAAGQLTGDYFDGGLHRAFSYTPDGMLCRQTRSPSALGAQAEESFRYGRDLELVGSHHSSPGVDERSEYAYDPAGFLIQHTDTRGKTIHYQNTPVGDRLVTTIGKESGGVARGEEWSRVGHHEGVKYCFDRTGNLTERSSPLGKTRLSWDAKGQVVASSRNGFTTTYAYDAIGRRVSKTTDGVRTRFIWSGETLIGDASFSGEAKSKPREVRTWIFVPESFSPLAVLVKRASGRPGDVESARLYVTDRGPNGCVSRLLSVQGDVAWTARLGAWGAARDAVGETDNPIRLQGQYEDSETGLHYNRCRYYDPEVGQFISPDPLGIWAGDNPYLFAPNAWGWLDPLGLTKKKQGCGSGIVFRALSQADREAFDRGEAIIPRGVGGSIADHVKGKPTGHISASLTEEAVERFDSGFGVVAINIQEATKGGTNFIDHNNVLQAARRSGDLTVARDARRAKEVLFRGPVPRSAMTLL